MSDNQTKVQPQGEISESRRNVLLGTAAVVTAVGMGVSRQAQASMDHSHHMHSVPSEIQDIIDASSGCVKAGQACVQHCIEMFKMKDLSMADCNDAVHDMLASCTAISQLASYQSKHLKDFAAACINVCKDCKKACEKHADKHEACKACAESCAECIKACKAYIA